MTKVENVDRQLVEEYDVSVGQENVVVGLFRALLDATKQDGNVSPMTFDLSAFKSSDVYQVKDEVAGQMKDYQTFKSSKPKLRKSNVKWKNSKIAHGTKKPRRQKPLQGIHGIF